MTEDDAGLRRRLREDLPDRGRRTAHGDGRFPVDVLLVFEDGHEIRERWDGQERWKMFVVERPSKLDYAEVDPDRSSCSTPIASNNSLGAAAESLAGGEVGLEVDGLVPGLCCRAFAFFM